MKCKFCNETLVSIGNKRKNGANHTDWEGRDLHKKCWKIIRKEEELKERCGKSIEEYDSNSDINVESDTNSDNEIYISDDSDSESEEDIETMYYNDDYNRQRFSYIHVNSDKIIFIDYNKKRTEIFYRKNK